MKASMELLVRGLLVLALGGYAIGCGDDSGGDNKVDSGVDSGTPAGGTGGKPVVDGGGSGGTGGAPSSAMCIADTTKLVGTMTPAACVSCACTKDAKATLACDAMCWGLIDCVVQKCAGQPAMTCAPVMCGTFLGGATTATALGMVLTGMCATECATSPGGGDDAGADAGN